MSLKTVRLVCFTSEPAGSMVRKDGSVVTAARSAAVQGAAAVVVLAVALGLALLDVLLLLPHAASIATMAIASRAAIDHGARRRIARCGAR
jgi:hypothetical protein